MSSRVQRRWEESFADLVAFKKKHGHTLVRATWQQPRSFGRWVSRQRTRYRLGIMPPEQRRRLEKIGFLLDTIRIPTAENFTRLRQFHRQHGHWNVPSGSSLGLWTRELRAKRKRGLLAPGLVRRLDAIGFEWKRTGYGMAKSDTQWDRRFEELRAHEREHGKSSPLGDSALGKWATTQRHARRLGRLSDERIRRLDSIGVRWNPREEHFTERMAWLLAFRGEYGHCRVPGNYPDQRLASFVVSARSRRQQGTLPAHRIAAFDAIGFSWNSPRISPANRANPAYWAERMARLLAFRDKYGHCRVSGNYPDQRLAGFVARARRRKRQGTLPAQRLVDLEAVGFDWNPRETSWTKQMARLLAFRKEHGHCRVPSAYRDRGLVRFLHNTRAGKRQGTLSAQRIAELDAIGLYWKSGEQRWREQMARLLSFHKKHGHCRVPSAYPDRGLASFVGHVRKLRRHGRLPEERSAELDALGFDRLPPGKQWTQGMARLRAFRNEHGHCRVRSTDPDRYLANFAAKFRSRKRHGKLPADQIAELDALGLDWNPLEDNWAEDMARLLSFRKEHGHCRVPSAYPVRRLAHFVFSTRAGKRQGTLSTQRIAELEAIGFEWKVLGNNWAEHMARLLAFRKEHGHCRVPSAYPVRRLAHFVFSARARKRNGKLPAHQIAELDAIGFSWSVREATGQRSKNRRSRNALV